MYLFRQIQTYFRLYLHNMNVILTQKKKYRCFLQAFKLCIAADWKFSEEWKIWMSFCMNDFHLSLDAAEIRSTPPRAAVSCLCLSLIWCLLKISVPLFRTFQHVFIMQTPLQHPCLTDATLMQNHTTKQHKKPGVVTSQHRTYNANKRDKRELLPTNRQKLLRV